MPHRVVRIGSIFGQIEPIGRKVRGYFRQNFENFVRTKTCGFGKFWVQTFIEIIEFIRGPGWPPVTVTLVNAIFKFNSDVNDLTEKRIWR